MFFAVSLSLTPTRIYLEDNIQIYISIVKHKYF